MMRPSKLEHSFLSLRRFAFFLAIFAFLPKVQSLADSPSSLIVDSSNQIFGEETTLFDLYLSDTFQGAILTTYTEESFEIDDPSDLVSQLKNISDPDKVVPLVSGKINQTREIPGVGSIRIDLRTFRIILILDASLLPKSALKTTGKLPDPNREFSLLQNFRTATTGALDQDFIGSLNHRTVAAHGKYFSRLDGTFVENQPYVLTEALAGGVAGDFEVGAGFLQTPGQTFASSVDVVGFRMKTSDQIWEDQEIIRGSKLSVFIPSRSRVEFYRDGRLIGVQVLDYGLQDVNTRQFPDGSYDVDIVINEDNGGIQRETRFYTKSGYLALTDKPMWDFAVGVGRDQLSLFNIPVYQAGLRWRIADALQLGGSAYGTEGTAVFDFSALTFYRDNFLTVGASTNSSGNQGIYGTLAGNALGLTYSVSAARTLNPETTVQDTFTAQTDRNRELISSRINDLTRERENLSANLYKQIDNFQIGVVGTKNKRVPDPFFNSLITTKETPIEDRFAYGPRIEWRIFEDTVKALRFESFYLHADDGDNITARLSFRYRFDPILSTVSEIRNDSTGGKNDTIALNTVNYDARSRQNYGFRGIYTNELRKEERRNKQTSVTNNGQAIYMNDYLKTEGFIRDIRGGINDSTNFGAEGSGAFILDNTGDVTISRPINEGAALVVNLESETSTAKFNVFLNDQPIETVKAGQETIIGIQPYRTYRISIRPAESNEMLSYDNTGEEFTVFPGNIVKRTWKINSVVVVVGRVVDANGIPIALKRLKGTKDYVATDETGSFQADLAGDESLLIESKDLKCKIPTPDIKNFKGYLMDVGDITCSSP